MRKKIICFILTLTIVMLTACGNTDAENKTKYIQDYWGSPDDEQYSIRVDKETGVNYIVYDGFYGCGITPRLNADGTPYVSEVNND